MLTLQIPKYHAVGTTGRQNKITQNEAGRLQLVRYFSKMLIPAEQNYNIYDHELLALVWSLEHWRHLLMETSHPIKVFTNHEGLTGHQAQG